MEAATLQRRLEQTIPKGRSAIVGRPLLDMLDVTSDEFEAALAELINSGVVCIADDLPGTQRIWLTTP